MKEITAISPDNLIVTDPTDIPSVSRGHLPNEPFLPIVVVAHHHSGLLILDGNCRAYLLTHLNVPIRAFLLTRDEDRDLLLDLQFHRKIPPFPHHEYLMEKMNLDTLRLRAIENAQRYGFLTVRRLLEMDPETIEPVSIPAVSETANIHVPGRNIVGSKPVECIVLYDRQREYFLPIVPTRLKEARKSGYDCVKVTDQAKIQEGVAWARDRWDRLDADVHQLVDVW